MSHKKPPRRGKLKREIKQVKKEIVRDEVKLQADEQVLQELESRKKRKRFKSYKLRQRGGKGMAIKGITPGQTGQFKATGAPQPGQPTPPINWTTDNPLAVPTLEPSDPSGLTVNVALDPTATGDSFNLKITDESGATSGPINVPIVLPAFTSYTVDQLS